MGMVRGWSRVPAIPICRTYIAERGILWLTSSIIRFSEMICSWLKLNWILGRWVRAEAGAMTYMDAGVQMQTGTGGGMFKGFKRMLTGESFFYHHLHEFDPLQAKGSLWGPLSGQNYPHRPDTARRAFYVPEKIHSYVLPGVLRSRSPLPRGLGPACSAERVLSCSASKEMAWLSYTQEAH